jgi:alkanesulfonate monooxygenase SsuD/methylene tetrahydromethanopterin reductase-like flavin-dependent oxidoreductase (luciferase family)
MPGMKFFAFHLMPYRHLDFAAASKYESYWVEFPNTFYDTQKGAALYREYIEQLIYAAECGFDGICVNEHHQNAYGLMPAPNLIASILIDRTRDSDVKIAILGRALPLVNNPLNIAEEYAMLDNISNGRIIAGFVRGIGAEYHSTGINPVYSHERFHEAHDLIVKAWTQPGPVVHQGDHFNFNYVNTWPRPYQKPHPPIWIPSQGSAETITWAADPKRKYPFIVTFSPVESVLRYQQMYRQEALRFGYEADGTQLGWAAPIYVAETDAIARRESEAHIETLFNNFLHIPPELLFPPGYTSVNSLKAIMKNRRGTGFERQTFDQLVERGMFIVGSPATVREKIEAAHARTGFQNLVCMIQFGTLPDPLVRKNVQMLTDEVLPKLRQVSMAA